MRRTLALLVVIGLLAPACGSDEEDEVREAVTTYLKAVAEGDGPKACGRLTPAAQRQLVASVFGARDCNQAVDLFAERLPDRVKSRMRDPEIEDVEVDGSRATVRVKDVEQGALEKVDGEWKIAAEPPAGGKGGE